MVLLGQSDEDGWEDARVNGFTVVLKDSDSQQRSLLYGHPPKLVWLRIGNCTRQQLFWLTMSRERDIHVLGADPF